jgi:branched-chain amino acid transport system substrate-binding protein
MGGVLFFILALIIGCAAPKPTTTPPATPAAPKSIIIGLMISQSGYDSTNGPPAKNGYELAVEKINQDGGIYVKEFDKKIPLELIAVDMESNPEKAIARAEALNSQYKAVVCCGTTLASATADIWEKNQLPFVATAIATAELHQKGFRYWFNIHKLNPDHNKAIFGLFDSIPTNIRPTKWAIWEEQMDWVAEFFTYARQQAPAHGVNFVTDLKYPILAPDMSQLIQQAKKAGAEVVVSLPTTIDAMTMLKQMKELNYKPKALIMIRGADDPFWAKYGAIGDYVIISIDWHPSLKWPGVKELNEMYQAKFGKLTHPLAGDAYASIQIVADAIQRAGTLDRTKVRDAIATTDLMTVTGPIKFRADGSRSDRPLLLQQWQNGVMENIWPSDFITKPLVYPRPYP